MFFRDVIFGNVVECVVRSFYVEGVKECVVCGSVCYGCVICDSNFRCIVCEYLLLC